MEYIYLENFRNIKSMILELKDLNFLIGENSTGKTSLLTLLNLVNSESFWMNFNFNNSEFQLGGYEDIAGTENKFFKIGLMRANEKGQSTLIRLNFIDRDGMPYLSEFILEDSTKQMFLNNEMENGKYSIIKKSTKKDVNSPKDYSLDDFQAWLIKIDELKRFENSYPDKRNIDNTPFIFLISLILSASTEKTTKGMEINLSLIPYWSPTSSNSWIAPMRAKPKQYYPGFEVPASSEGDHMPYLMKDLFDSKKKNRKRNEVKIAMEKFGAESGLFDEIKTEKLGNKKTAPFEIDIIKNGKPYNFASMGYGISQILPILLEMTMRRKNTIYYIQQPEVHLHPKAQAALGELLYTVVAKDKKKFYVETHSDFMIDRFRYVQNNTEDKLDAQVLFFESIQGVNVIQPILINADGSYGEQPDNFKKFFITESMKMLVI